jgi:hypothetical protein
LKPIVHEGQVISIDHLSPFLFDCPCEDIGRPLVIRVVFANHCYTKKYDPSAHTPEQIVLTEGDRHRVFCPIRHGLSHRLPALIVDLPGKRVHQTSQVRNYVYVVPLEIAGNPYEIYFMLQRAQGAGEADLRLTVESAYQDKGAPNVRKRPNTIRFAVLAHKMLTGQSVRFAAR